MKKTNRSLTAAAVATALAFGGVAVAQAQNPAPAPAAEQPADNAELENAAPATKQDANGNTWYQHLQDKSFYVQNPNDANMPITPEMREAYDKAFPAPAAEQPGNGGIPAPATKQDAEGNTWYQHMKDKTLYVKDSGQVNSEITPEMREAYNKAFPNGTAPEAETPGSDSKNLAWLALPAALVIGGIVWHLAKDGKTYVKDENRAKAEPTAEEKAESEKMLAQHKDEVIAQGGKLAGNGAPSQNGASGAQANEGEHATTNRGMLAHTGSNTVARGLAALAVAAMVAAGAVVARRKMFA